MFKRKYNVKGIFDNWEIDDYKITCGDYNLWIASGFFYFQDNLLDENAKPFLKGMGIILRYQLWKEVEKIIKKRETIVKDQSIVRIKKLLKQCELKK